MGADIVDLDRERRDRSPHIGGEAECMLCKRRWTAVAPTGTTWLECPSCGSEKGHFIGAAIRDLMGFSCDCGNGMFILYEDNTVGCPNCGITHATYEFIEE